MTSGRYQAYPEYKDSGEEWLDTIPEHWAPKPLKFITEFINGCAFKPSEWAPEGTPIIRIENLNGGDDFNFHKGKIDPRYEVAEGDLLFGWSGNRGTSFGPFLWGREGKHYLNQHIFRLDGFRCSKRWLYWTLRAVTYYIEEQAHGIIGMVHVTKGKIGGIAIPEMPLAEQTQIAAFLDHETVKIDRLIEKQQALIGLLKEKRQAVISHAVTQGLNPHAPLKDSGIEWLGQVPEHWAMSKVSYIGRVRNGSTPDKTNLAFWTDGTIPWLGSSCLNDAFVRVPTELITRAAFSRSSVELIPPGSLLVGMVGQGKTRGSSSILTIESCINQNVAAIIPNGEIEVKFLYYIFQAMYDDLRELGRGGNQAALNCEIIGALRIPLPSHQEQSEIVLKLDYELKIHDQTSDLAHGQITLLQERRTALISAAVTGKIDVRHWQPPSSANAAAHDGKIVIHEAN